MTDSDDDRFYRAFEESFRGSQTETRGKLEAYRPLLETLIQHRPHARAIDLGCGRGEFLDFLSGLGFEAEGVDLDAGMLAAARARGFDVRLADATTSLRALPDASRDVVSGFHIVEHLSFQTLRDMTREALRVLAPGGVLIYETPNPENVNVGIHTFHMDPTHIKPLPPAFLRFLVSFEGARRAHVWRLQHDPRLPAKTAPSFRDLFFGVSPDYAVVGQKGGDEALETALDFAFEGHGGVDLYTLAARLDQSQARSSGDIQTTFATHQQNLATHGRTLAKLEPKLATLERRLDEALRQAQHRAEEAERLLAETRSSTSWRVTAPLRAAMRVALGEGGLAKTGERAETRILGNALALTRRHPAVRPVIWRLASLAPGGRERFRRLEQAYDAAARARTIEEPRARLAELEAEPVGLRARAVRAALQSRRGEEPR